jgi:anaerobic dimethyl sulfoxide reductase subunit B (iron-sulfur subunit)
MTQYGFFFDQSRCSGCRACALACKSWHGLPAGPLKYLKIYEYEKGTFPKVRMHFQWVPCYHCEDPVCLSNCPSEAIYKEDKYGAVLIDMDKCNGCRKCYNACPYGAPVFESDEIGVKAQKCTMCTDRLEMGLKPICVLACPDRALDFGSLSDLISRYGERRDLEDMPNSQVTYPAVIFKPHIEKRQLVHYDSQRAIRLMMEREPLPQVFSSPEDMIGVPGGMVGRDRLILKHKSTADMMRNTRSDEG